MPQQSFRVDFEGLLGRKTSSSWSRLPYRSVHVAPVPTLPAQALKSLAQVAFNKVPLQEVGDIDTAWLTAEDLRGTGVSRTQLTALLREVLGGLLPQIKTKPAQSRPQALVCQGSGYHTDAAGAWPCRLFWVLPLHAQCVEFCSPLADHRHTIDPGCLFVFDPALPHAVCASGDAGHWSEESFKKGTLSYRQAFLAGEIALRPAQWSALDCPWLPSNSPCMASLSLLRTTTFSDSGFPQ